MNFQQVEFEMSAGVSSQLPRADVPEIVFSGKSNVGKSSLINKTGQPQGVGAGECHTGGKPLPSTFSVCPRHGWWTCPGMGTQKYPRRKKKRWSELMEGYFAAGRPIATVVQILDYRHAPTAEDQNMLQFLIEQGHSVFWWWAPKWTSSTKTQRQKQQAWF